MLGPLLLLLKLQSHPTRVRRPRAEEQILEFQSVVVKLFHVGETGLNMQYSSSYPLYSNRNVIVELKLLLI